VESGSCGEPEKQTLEEGRISVGDRIILTICPGGWLMGGAKAFDDAPELRHNKPGNIEDL
jgi:hypothetical protein